MIELTSSCICVTERGGGDLPYERCRLPPLVHSSLPPIFSKRSNTWQIRPPWGLPSFSLSKRGFLPHLAGCIEPLFNSKDGRPFHSIMYFSKINLHEDHLQALVSGTSNTFPNIYYINQDISSIDESYLF